MSGSSTTSRGAVPGGTVFSPNPAAEGKQALYRDLKIGTPRRGEGLFVGGGGAYTSGMLVYQETAGVFTDVSELFGDPSVATNLFGGVANNDAVYICSSLFNGSDFLQHPGLEVLVSTAIVLGGGSIICEYWNGGAWVELATLSTQASGRYLPYAKLLFERTGQEHIRYDNNIANDVGVGDWVKNDPIVPALGTSYFWARFRIVGGITTSPALDTLALHTAGVELASDGYIQLYGTARSEARLPWDIGMVEAAAGPTSPTNQDIFLSKTLDVGRIENLFAAGAHRTGTMLALPTDLDTSSGIHLHLSWAADTAGGNVEWTIRWGHSKNGDAVYFSTAAAPATAPNERSLSIVSAVPGAFVQTTSEIVIDVSSFIAKRESFPDDPDWLWITVERAGGVGLDTNAGSVAILNVHPHYWRWNLGGHL